MTSPVRRRVSTDRLTTERDVRNDGLVTCISRRPLPVALQDVLVRAIGTGIAVTGAHLNALMAGTVADLNATHTLPPP